MHNLYLIESNSSDVIKDAIAKILDEQKVNRDALITYDMEEVNIADAIMDLDTYSFFNTMKIVHCKNATFLGTGKCEIEHDLDTFTKYLNNPNPNNILILSLPKCDGKKNVVKLLKEKAQILDGTINLETMIKRHLDDYKMSKETIQYLIESCASDIERINNELDKLMAYKENKNITKEDIDLVVIKKMDNNIFDLIDAIISKNKAKSLSIYKEMINHGEDVFRLFVSLANQIRLIYQVKNLKRYANDEIATKLGLKNPKQVAALRYKIDKYTNNELIDYLHKLSIMDEELKTGKSIDTIVFPTFIASL